MLAGMTVRDSAPRGIHPAWIVLAAMTLCMAAVSGIRAVFGVYIKPLEAEFGWSRSAISGVAALSLLLLGQRKKQVLRGACPEARLKSSPVRCAQGRRAQNDPI